MSAGCPPFGVAASVPLDDLALVTGSDGSLALLNESAGVIMGRLLEGAGVDGAADALVARYGISRRQAAADAESAAEELVRLGLWQASTPTERRVQAEVGEPAPPEAPGWRFDEILAPIERPVRVQVSSPRLAKLVAAMLGGDRGDPSREPPAATISAFRRRGHELWLDGRRVLADADLLLARSELVRHLLLASGAERRWLAVLHAAVVSDGEAAVILSGASGSGKSTLAARLVDLRLGPGDRRLRALGGRHARAVAHAIRPEREVRELGSARAVAAGAGRPPDGQDARPRCATCPRRGGSGARAARSPSSSRPTRRASPAAWSGSGRARRRP